MSDPATGRPATLLDLARAAGVSRTTASNAFNRPDQLSPALRRRILEAADRLGYGGPHPAARMLRTGRSGAVGLVFPDPLPHAFSDDAAIGFLRGVALGCETRHAGLLILPTSPPDQIAARIRDAAVDGFIIYCCPDDSPVIDAVAARRLPTVAVELGRFHHGAQLRIDDEGGAAAAARHLLAHGHRRLAIIALEFTDDLYEGAVDEARIAAATFAVTLRRLRGYRQEFARVGLRPADVPIREVVRNSPDAAMRATLELLQGPRPPTAILAMSDMLALGVLRAAGRLGLAVPGQLSVVGFDDVPMAGELNPPLTTVRQPLLEKGRRAAELLFAGGPDLLETLPAEFVQRASTAPPPQPACPTSDP